MVEENDVTIFEAGAAYQRINDEGKLTGTEAVCVAKGRGGKAYLFTFDGWDAPIDGSPASRQWRLIPGAQSSLELSDILKGLTDDLASLSQRVHDLEAFVGMED